MAKTFSEIMAEKSNAKLVEITTEQRNDYQPAAVLAAEEELKKRNLDQNQKYEAQEELNQKKELNLNKATIPLESEHKALFFVFSIGIIPIIIASTFKSNGYTQKYKDAWRYMKFGFIIYAIMLLLLMLVIATIS